MGIFRPSIEPVPFAEVAEILAEAASRAPGGPPRAIAASGRHLAAALDAAGFTVVRDAPAGPQLCLR